MAYNPYETNSYGGYSAYRQIGVKDRKSVV